MPNIWVVPITPDALNERNTGTLAALFGIVFTKVEGDAVHAKMPITSSLLQPNGIVHGGAYCAFAETVASTAANYCVDPNAWYCVGVDLNINYIYAMQSGCAFAMARPFHLGKSTQVWSIDIMNEEGKRVSVCRMTLAVLPKKSHRENVNL